jgi:hypothetical protein
MLQMVTDGATTSLWWCCKKEVMVLPDGVGMLPAVH